MTKLWPRFLILALLLSGCRQTMPPLPPGAKPVRASKACVKPSLKQSKPLLTFMPGETNFVASIYQNQNNGVTLGFLNGSPCYQIESATNLMGSWTSVGQPILGQSKTLPVDAPAKFFRVRQGVILDLSVTGQPPTITWDNPEVTMLETIDYTDVFRNTTGFPPWGSAIHRIVGPGQTWSDTTPNNNPANAPFKTLFYKADSTTTPGVLTAQHKIGRVSTLASGAAMWGIPIGGVYSETSTCIAAHPDGSIFAAGNKNQHGGTKNPYVVKIAPNKTVIWEHIYFAAISDSTFTAITIDGDGNVLLTGHFSGQINFGGGELVSKGFDDIFIVKFDVAGNHLWSLAFGSPAQTFTSGYEAGFGIACDSANNVIVTGAFMETISTGYQFAQGGTVTVVPMTTLTNGGGQNIFIIKFTKDGAFLWNKFFGSDGSSVGVAVGVDAQGRIIVTGHISGTVNFGGLGLNTGAFVVQFLGSGSHVWSVSFGLLNVDCGRSVVFDALNNPVVCGNLSGQLFVKKLSVNDGSVLWSKSFGGGNDTCTSVAVSNSTGAIYAAGSSRSGINLGSGVTAGASDGWNMFIAKFDSSDGTPRFAKTATGNFNVAVACALDGVGNLLAAGWQSGGAAVDFGGGVTVTSNGLVDWFVLKLAP